MLDVLAGLLEVVLYGVQVAAPDRDPFEVTVADLERRVADDSAAAYDRWANACRLTADGDAYVGRLAGRDVRVRPGRGGVEIMIAHAPLPRGAAIDLDSALRTALDRHALRTVELRGEAVFLGWAPLTPPNIVERHARAAICAIDLVCAASTARDDVRDAYR